MFGWLYHRYLTTKGSNHHFGVAQIRHFQPQSHSKIHIPSPYSVVHSFPYGSQESPTGRRFPKMPSPPFESSWIIHFRLFFSHGNRPSISSACSPSTRAAPPHGAPPAPARVAPAGVVAVEAVGSETRASGFNVAGFTRRHGENAQSYPLVISGKHTKKTMERSTIFNGKSTVSTGPFSIAFWSPLQFGLRPWPLNL